ncbi:MAG: hypothetical protein MRT15_12195 [archaeon YNP-LCB-003-016]|uniref:hypothetical protein n=1 Tax=Candidatus Culexarchaeum yellowstonense TaxID=2928963 RepID=UPI0026EC35A3|nr:hypothetical protein [Candidatus Culexarchaeum yellowstonense]MCR6693147.1 hypothetical protein [Candidatus Culexarchaeum yellowstonense]
MKGVRKSSLLYIIPLIALLTILIFCGNVYAVIQEENGGTEVIWGHIYPPSGGTYHYHTIGYFAWTARWVTSFKQREFGYIYMGGTEGTTSWYCGGQQWWSEPSLIKYNIKVIKIKDLTTQTEYTDPSVLRCVGFVFGKVWPSGSQESEEIVNLLLDVIQGLFDYFAFPIPFKLSSSYTSVGNGWSEITVYGCGSLSKFSTNVVFNAGDAGLPDTHTYEVTCRLTWTASFIINVEGGLQGRNPIEGEGIISPESGQAVDIAYAYATMDITFTVPPS